VTCFFATFFGLASFIPITTTGTNISSYFPCIDGTPAPFNASQAAGVYPERSEGWRGWRAGFPVRAVFVITLLALPMSLGEVSLISLSLRN
jgi:hypothetical protein